MLYYICIFVSKIFTEVGSIMDSFNDVLDAAKEYCREHTADATYQYYISGLKAVSFENSNCITLEVRNDFICKIVSDRYTGLLREAF